MRVGSWAVFWALVCAQQASAMERRGDDTDERAHTSAEPSGDEELFRAAVKLYNNATPQKEEREKQANYKAAFEFFEKAANQGHAEAQLSLGEMYEKGYGADQSYEETFKCYKKAANQGLAEAQFRVGVMYFEGQGVGQSVKEAFEWFQKAVGKGHVLANYRLGLVYEEGWEGVVDQSYVEAFKYHEKAAKQGLAEAQFRMGSMNEGGWGVDQSYEEAFKCYKKAANQDLAEAQVSLGEMYEKGYGVDQSYGEAFKCYEKAAAKGHLNAKYKLGFMYEQGQGVLPSGQEAAQWFIKALGQRQGLARNPWLGVSYFLGSGVLKDKQKAQKHHNRCLLLENGTLESVCSVMSEIKRLADSIGGTFTFSPFFLTLPGLEAVRDDSFGKDLRDIATMYSQGAEKRERTAQFRFGILHFLGLEIRQDLLLAFEWWNEAAQQGDPQTKELLKEMNSVLHFLPPIVESSLPQFLIKRYPQTTDLDVLQVLEASARAGDPSAWYRLGKMHLYGWGTERNAVEAKICFEKALEKKRYAPALKALADMDLAENKQKGAVCLYRQAAKQGDKGATAALAKMAENYSSDAIYALAQAHEEGWGIAKEEDEALELYKRAASVKHPKAQYKVALQNLDDLSMHDLLSQGSGTDGRRAYLKAIRKKYNRREIENLGEGYYKAQQALADLYTKGRIIGFKSFENIQEAYTQAYTLQMAALKSQGKHLRHEPITQIQSQYDKLQKAQNFDFEKNLEARLQKNFPELYQKREMYAPDFLYQVAYVTQRVTGTDQETVHKMMRRLIEAAEKKGQTKLSQGLITKLIKAVEEKVDLKKLSPLFELALSQRSCQEIPSPTTAPQNLKLSSKALHDERVEIFNACLQTPDHPVSPDVFSSAVGKILTVFRDLKAKGLITEEGLTSPEGIGTEDTLKALLTHKSDLRFMYRIVRLSDIFDNKVRKDPESVAAQLTSWALAGNFCSTRSEEETYLYYLAQLTDPDQDLNDLGKDYWTLEMYVARSLAQLRERLVDNLVPQAKRERVHQTAYLKRKACQSLSLLGDAEDSHDTLESSSVQKQYQDMSSQAITEQVLKKYTPEIVIEHLASAFQNAEIPYEKLLSRLRFQFLRSRISEASGLTLESLDQTSLRDEDFVLSDACDRSYLEKQPDLMNLPREALRNWETWKGYSYEEAQTQLETAFYEDHMMKFSQKGACAILKGLRYLEAIQY